MKENHASLHLAAVDLGSNSFHMVVTRIEDGHVHILDRIKEMVRLGAGIDEDRMLTEEAQETALACLKRFGERVRDFPTGSVAAVGTNTLRTVRNSREFIKKANKALGHEISIIGGLEEARLIYLGVSHSLARDDGKRFVMDIGGGSTELIIGENFEPVHLESLHMGCVSISKRFFSDEKFSEKNWKKANMAAHLELRPFKKDFRNIGWGSATGASGSIKAVGKVVRSLELDRYGITLDAMYHIRDLMIEAGSLDKLSLPGLSEQRKPVFAGGLAVLMATFEALKIGQMTVSDGALREGLIYERLGRIEHEDTREKTVKALQSRFHISQPHARRVSRTAYNLFTLVEAHWELAHSDAERLHWAANLHEIGMAIAHNNFHKHGAYMLQHADMPGFSLEEQDWMSVIVRTHRRKMSHKHFEAITPEQRTTVLRLSILLRLAGVLHRSREDKTVELVELIVTPNGLELVFAEKALKARPLLKGDLEQEAQFLRNVGFELRF